MHLKINQKKPPKQLKIKFFIVLILSLLINSVMLLPREINASSGGSGHDGETEICSPTGQPENPYINFWVTNEWWNEYIASHQIFQDYFIKEGDGCHEPRTGAIKICKFDDVHNPLAGWEITASSSSILEKQTTGADGCTIFTQLPFGLYSVSETLQSGWTQVKPGGDGVYDVGLTRDCPVKIAKFVNEQTGEPTPGIISGFKYSDADGLASTTNDRTGLNGWQINLFNSSSTTTPVATTTTNQTGFYQFPNLNPDTYSLTENLLSGWTQIVAPTSSIIITAGASSTNNNFVNFHRPGDGGGEIKGLISGFKYGDADGSASTTNDRTGLSGWVINLFNSSSTTTPQTSTSTDQTGFYQFPNLNPDTYSLTENLLAGWMQIVAPTSSIIITSGASSTNNNFVNFQQQPTGGGGGGGGGGGSVVPPSGSSGSTQPPSATGSPLLVINKTVKTPIVSAGAKNVEFEVFVTNNGNQTALNVVLTDVLPNKLVYSDGSGDVKTINIGNLAPGEIKSFKFLVDVSSSANPGNYTNTVRLTSSNFQPLTASATVTIRPTAVLGIKVLPDTGFDYGEAIALVILAISCFGLARILKRA